MTAVSTFTRFLHVLNGDATRLKLERSAVPGKLTVWADVLHEGPCLLVAAEAWRQVRARFLAGDGETSEAEVLETYRRWDDELDRFREHDEVVFWFEHDLFDQLLLVRHLHWLASVPDRGKTVFSLICIGEFPGVPNFVGLGMLAPDQLASLLETRTRIDERHLRLGAETWARFCAPEPLPLQNMLTADTSALPFLHGALRRFLEDYPAADTGLSRSERQILRAVSDGAATPSEIFRATQRMEERIFMGDSTFWSIARRLASGRAPLIEIDRGSAPDHGPVPPPPRRRRGSSLPDGTVRLTATGRAVLEGRADHVLLNGIDRWMGGVHLVDGRWRWNGERVEAAR